MSNTEERSFRSITDLAFGLELICNLNEARKMILALKEKIITLQYHLVELEGWVAVWSDKATSASWRAR